MLPTGQGSLRLFRLAGISVYLHWSWFLVAVFVFEYRGHQYSSMVWNAIEYLALFAIVLMHEFGHSLATRQVGGRADQIVLWPLGGVAYVAPPPRPGATLWSIAAGPLVNALLIPVLASIYFLVANSGWAASQPDLMKALRTIQYINAGLLIFNMLPIYPLDGGQILQSLLWFVAGRARSLMIASVIGMLGVAGLIGVAVLYREWFLGIVAVFILMNCWQGLRQAQILGRIARMPRQTGYRCPECKEPPIKGPIAKCGSCAQRFDPFAAGGVCPKCGEIHAELECMECGRRSTIARWTVPPPIVNPTEWPR